MTEATPPAPTAATSWRAPAGKAQQAEPGCLYLVATPIGNLRDITLRALDILASVDLIACEDSRITQRLLQAYGIDRPLLPYHDHNGEKMRPKLLAALEAGQSVALVSDAGTPLISDPGYKLVQGLRAAAIPVFAIPGPSAMTAALCSSGLPTDHFTFAGFAPPKGAARRQFLQRFSSAGTVVFYETAPRLVDFLADCQLIFADCPIVVLRELTKKFEEYRSGNAAELYQHYRAVGAPKGELVILVATGQGDSPQPSDGPSPAERLDRALQAALGSGATLKQAVADVTAATGLPRKQVYARALALNLAKDNGS